jgi:DnaJ-domain-containing protein 1
MTRWILEHWWQLAVFLLTVGAWMAHVEDGLAKVNTQQASLEALAGEMRNVKWSLDSLRLELRHMNRALDALLVVNGAR